MPTESGEYLTCEVFSDLRPCFTCCFPPSDLVLHVGFLLQTLFYMLVSSFRPCFTCVVFLLQTLFYALFSSFRPCFTCCFPPCVLQTLFYMLFSSFRPCFTCWFPPSDLVLHVVFLLQTFGLCVYVLRVCNVHVLYCIELVCGI